MYDIMIIVFQLCGMSAAIALTLIFITSAFHLATESVVDAIEYIRSEAWLKKLRRDKHEEGDLYEQED